MNKVIINADDFGISSNVNSAIIKCFQDNIINRTTIMMNMPFTQEAVIASKRYGFSDSVGLHLNLTAGKPIKKVCYGTRLSNDGVYFSGFLSKSKFRRFFLNKSIAKAIAVETEAQIVAYLDSGFTLKHIDSHQHIHTNYAMYMIIKPILLKYGFKSIRISRNIPKEEIKFHKRIYKRIFNENISIADNKDNLLLTTKYMGSQKDFLKHYKKSKLDGVAEIMVHPFLNSKGKISDNNKEFKIAKLIKNKEITLIDL